MKKIIFLLATALLAQIYAGSLWAKNDTPKDDPGVRYQRLVTGMENLVANLKTPFHLFDPEAEKKGTEFDPMQYFTVLPDLSMPDGYVLDYVYQQVGSAGHPRFYIRPRNKKPYRNLKEYRQYENEASSSADEQWKDITRSVQAKDMEIGYFEWVLFYLKAPHFYLWKWAATDYKPICDRKRLQDLVKGHPNMPKETAEKALGIDPTPRVRMMPDRVEVRLVSFTGSGGFYEELFTVSRRFPHEIIAHKGDCLVKYGGGIKY